MRPKKLIRTLIVEKLSEGEWETIQDQCELNRLYALKVMEELSEIQSSDHCDVMEFADLVEVAFSFAEQNGFDRECIYDAMARKRQLKGSFDRCVLNRLNPENPSNALYFSSQENSEKEYEYEMLFNSEPNEPIQIHGWYPIATNRIRKPEKIDYYIKTGLLRRIQ